MGDIRTRRFHWLKPGTIYTFSVQAISGSAQSDPATISLKTSGEIGMTWPKNAKIMARPVFWSRTIVVKWTLMQEPLRMDNYRLFRKEGSLPTPAELADYSTSNQWYLKDCGRWAYHTDHLTGTVMGLSDFGKEIEKEVPYYYWVWAFDKAGRQSATYLGPDVAEFGKPNKPKFTGGTTSVHERNKWWCDYKVTWECVGGCEHYLLQRKLQGFPFWGPVFIVQHDESLGEENQEHTFDNLLCSKKYDFRVRAVNIPMVYVSDWAYATYETGEDTVRPNEIELVAGRRLYHGRKLFGDYIKLTWKRPTNAIIEQQIDFYRIYRLKGTDDEANAYKALINNSANADDPVKPEPFSESTKFHGTYFTDDDLEELPNSSIVTVEKAYTWDAEGSNDTERATLYDPDGNSFLVCHAHGTTPVIDTTKANSGSYSMKIPSGSFRYMHWDIGAGMGFADFDEGELEFYFQVSNITVTGPIFEIGSTNLNGYFRFTITGSPPILQFERAVSLSPIYANTVSGELTGKNNVWIKVNARWSVANNQMSVQVDGLGWHDTASTVVTVGTTKTIRWVEGGHSDYTRNDVTYIDDIRLIYFAQEGSPSIYYHYWVTAVDIIGLESLVSGPEDENEGTASYDKVSFSPPPEPTNVNVEWNTALNILSVKLMAAKFSWDAIDEATYFRVKVRSRPLGTKPDGSARDWSKWFSSPYLREERIDDPDGSGKYYTWPFPFLQGQSIEYTVLAFNAAGESPYTKRLATVGPDTIPPSEIQNLWGRCYGMYSLLGRKLWIGTKLTWDDLPAYEGIKLYRVEIWNPLAGPPAWEWVGNAHPTVGSLKVSFYDPGQPIANSHKFRVKAIDWDAQDENDVNHAGPWKEITITWLQWWKLASS